MPLREPSSLTPFLTAQPHTPPMYSSKQGPTISHLRVRTTKDAKKIFEAVLRGHLPMVTQRLDPDQRRQISSGQVYVWEERSSNRSRNSSSGIERWTDSISWGQSHVKDEFLFYDEKERADTVYPSSFVNGSSRILGWASRGLIKQTYSVYIKLPPGSPELFAKWHMTAYSTASTVDSLFTVDNHLYFPFLQSMEYPPDRYTSARGGGRMTPPALPSRPKTKEPSLAPLDFLRRQSPHARHPVDEEAIMSFPIYETLSCY